MSNTCSESLINNNYIDAVSIIITSLFIKIKVFAN